MKYLLAKDVGLACGSFVFHAIISTYFDLFSKGSQWANLQRSAQVSRLAGAHKALGTLRTGLSGHRRTHTASSFRNSAWHFRRSVCLVSEGHQLIALVRSWSVDVSFLWSDPFFPLFPIGVFRGGRQWLQLRVIVSEDASCESQSRTNSEPAVIHLRFGS